MSAVDRLRFEFLCEAMKLFKDKSPLIASSCGVNAMNLCRRNEKVSILSETVCKGCGQILIFGKTKTIRFKTRIRNRFFTMSMLSRSMHKRKSLNYAVITCLHCNDKTYQAITTFKYLKKMRMNKLKLKSNKKAVVKLKKNNTVSDTMKLNSKRIGLKTMNNFKQMSKNKMYHKNNENIQRQNQVNRLLLGLSSSKNTNIKMANNDNKRSISNNFDVKFKKSKWKKQKRKSK